MENHESIIQEFTIDSSGQAHLFSAGRWAKFIGIIYLIMAGFSVLITILLFANLDHIADTLMDINGMSQEALDFMMGAGKWIFLFCMILSCLILVMNGLFLVNFGTNSGKYFHTQDENRLLKSFSYLGRYLMLTTILSTISTVFSVVAFLYYFLS